MDLVEGGLSVEEDIQPLAPAHASVEELEIAEAAARAGEPFPVPAERIPGPARHCEGAYIRNLTNVRTVWSGGHIGAVSGYAFG